MRILLTLLGFSLLNIATFAQVQTDLLFEDFQSGIPSTFTLRNLDGHTPDAFVSYITDAWVTKDNEHNPGVNDSVAVSTGYYNAGATPADDWMITPGLVFTANAFLRYKVLMSDGIDVSSMEVRIATDTAIASFLGNPVLETITVADLTDYTREIRQIDLGAAGYVGDTFYIAFRNNTNNDTFNLLMIDSIYVFETYTIELGVTKSSVQEYLAVNTSYPVKGTIHNYGADTVTSMRMNWQLDNGVVNQQYLDGLQVIPFTDYNFTHNTNLNISTTGSKTIRIWADSINDQADQNTINDTLIVNAYVMSQAAAKSVLFEKFSGTWHGWMPEADYRLDQIVAANPNVIPVAVHLNDSMQTLPPYNTDIVLQFSKAGDVFRNGSFNRALIDRYKFNDASKVYIDMDPTPGFDSVSWINRVTERLVNISPVAITLENEFDTITRNLMIDLGIKFYAPVNGDYRVNCYLVEDSVTGSGTLYDQTNLLNTAMDHPYEGAGNPIQGYIHRHVLRHPFGGTWGDDDVIATTVNAGDSFSQQYIFPTGGLPLKWNENRMSIVAFVEKYNPSDSSDRAVLNAVSGKLTLSADSNVFIANISSLQPMKIYPNPVSDIARIELAVSKKEKIVVEIFDVLGRNKTVLFDGQLDRGDYYLTIDKNKLRLEAGIHVISLYTQQDRQSKVILVQ